ncbi:hypothetical protein, partial [Candidatus Methylomicrobium oryzae]|uniref:hypothetical protein n=1 Tax=Candidatus Methylomicrobium oryzae TaxID=2802053 RepID=UPI001F3692D5
HAQTQTAVSVRLNLTALGTSPPSFLGLAKNPARKRMAAVFCRLGKTKFGRNQPFEKLDLRI